MASPAPAAAPVAPASTAAAPAASAIAKGTGTALKGTPTQVDQASAAVDEAFEIKVDGQVRKFTRSEAERLLSKSSYADKVTQQAKELAKAAQKAQQDFAAKEAERQRRAKENTDDYLRELGIDPDEYARSKLERRVAEGKMSPEERRAAEAEARAKALEGKLAEQTKREEEQQRTQLTTRLERDIQGQLMGAVKRANMETGPDTLAALHAAMDDMMSLGLLPMDGTGLPAHVADRIVEDAQARINEQQGRLEKAMLAGVKGAALKARLGDAVYKEVLAYELEQVRSRRPGYKPPVAGAPAPVAQAPVAKPTGYKKISDYDARVRELAGKHTS